MITSIGDVMREAYKRGWITTRDGNISLRRRHKFYVTPSGWRKTIIHPEHVLRGYYNEAGKVAMEDRSKEPSGEMAMHLKLQSLHDGCKAIVHLHPTYTIAAMRAGFNLQKLADEFPELSRYTKVAPTVGVHPVCSRGLAIETFQRMSCGSDRNAPQIMYDIVGQKQHGVTAVADSPWDAFEHIERLEHICKIALMSGVKCD